METAAMEPATDAELEALRRRMAEHTCYSTDKDTVAKLIARLDAWETGRRVADLLEANNRYLEEARAARTALAGRFDLVAHLERQRAFSRKTFGPGARTKGVVDHIRRELAEIEADPADVMEWVDVVILAFDGAWRAGWEPAAIAAAIVAKQDKNEARTWPDWRTADPDKAIEHVRGGEAISGRVEIAHDGFAGNVIGHYTTREGKRGVVVQQDGTRVVHVYGEKWIAAIASDRHSHG